MRWRSQADLRRGLGNLIHRIATDRRLQIRTLSTATLRTGCVWPGSGALRNSDWSRKGYFAFCDTWSRAIVGNENGLKRLAGWTPDERKSLPQLCGVDTTRLGKGRQLHPCPSSSSRAFVVDGAASAIAAAIWRPSGIRGRHVDVTGQAAANLGRQRRGVVSAESPPRHHVQRCSETSRGHREV